MHVTVTAEAMKSVRRMIVGYGGFAIVAEVVEVPGVDDLARERVGRPEALDQERDEGGDVDEEERGDRGRDLPERLRTRAGARRNARASGGLPRGGSPPSHVPRPGPASYPLICGQAVVQARRSVQFFLPLPQSAIGVFQNLIEW